MGMYVTNAPAAYDYGYVHDTGIVIPRGCEFRNEWGTATVILGDKPWRLVTTDDDERMHRYQIPRYRSGDYRGHMVAQDEGDPTCDVCGVSQLWAEQYGDRHWCGTCGTCTEHCGLVVADDDWDDDDWMECDICGGPCRV